MSERDHLDVDLVGQTGGQQGALPTNTQYCLERNHNAGLAGKRARVQYIEIVYRYIIQC